MSTLWLYGNFPFPFTRFTDDGVGLHIPFPTHRLGPQDSTPISYSGHPRLTYQTIHKILWVRVFMFLHSIAMYVIPVWYLRSSHDRFLLRHFQFVLYSSSYSLTPLFELLKASFRGSQILVARATKFIRWHIITEVLILAYKNKGPEYGSFFLSPCLCLEFIIHLSSSVVSHVLISRYLNVLSSKTVIL